MSDLRPTLFLAQLSNLLAGNISIVHGVTGSSRTFMGEESAGVDAVRIALARIAAGQSELALVGGSHNGEREDLLLLYDAGGHMLRGPFQPVWERKKPAAWCSARSAPSSCWRRAATPRRAAPSRWRGSSAVMSERSSRPAGAVTAALGADVATASRRAAAGRIAVISGATGAEPATNEERAWLADHARTCRCARPAALLGHGFEPQFAMNIALAALALGREKLFPPVGFVRGRTGRMKVRSTRSPSPPSAIGAAKAWRWSRRVR